MPLTLGMCFSNEPLVCIYGEFGVRLEYHFYIIEDDQYDSRNRAISWKILLGTKRRCVPRVAGLQSAKNGVISNKTRKNSCQVIESGGPWHATMRQLWRQCSLPTKNV